MTIDELLFSMGTDPNPGNNDEIVEGVCKILHGMEPIAQRGDNKSNLHLIKWWSLEYALWAIERLKKEKEFEEVCPSCGFKIGKDIRRIWLKCKNEYHCPNCGQRIKFDIEEYRRTYLNNGCGKTSTRYNGVSYPWEHEDMGK